MINKSENINQFNYNDEEIGYWEWYYSNGNIKAKGNYINGEIDGYWEEYYTDRILSYKKYYV